jgi:hypothetical protein
MQTTQKALLQSLRQLRTSFDKEGHEHPPLRHFWVRGKGDVEEVILKFLAREFEQLPVNTTNWSVSQDDVVDVSCFLGDTDNSNDSRFWRSKHNFSSRNSLMSSASRPTVPILRTLHGSWNFTLVPKRNQLPL